VIDERRMLAEVVASVGEALRREEQRLCDLDAAVGDGDHGLTMVRCWALVEREAGGEDASVGEALERAGRAVVASGGGATGPLLGTGLIAAGRAAAEEAEPSSRAAAMLEAAAEEVERRGRAKLGDRTFLDALRPAAEAARRAAGDGRTLAEVVSASAEAAEAGAAATAELVARVGRATRLGERALGHPDPGAVSVAIMLRAGADRLAELA
jgi:phosphoenolpyruvate---glycerone phosphotransferase subunit DhaL